MIVCLPLDLPALGVMETSGRLLLCEHSDTGDGAGEPWNATDEPVEALGVDVRPGRWRGFADRDDFAMLLLVHEAVDRDHAALFRDAETIGAVIQDGASIAAVDAASRDVPAIANELREVETGAAELAGRGLRCFTGGDGTSLVSVVRAAGQVVAIAIGSRRIDTRWFALPADELFEALLGRWDVLQLHPDDDWPESWHDLLGFLDAALLTELADAAGDSGRDEPIDDDTIPDEAWQLVDRLVAQTEQPGVRVAVVDSPDDDGTLAVFLAANFEIARLRTAGLTVR